MDFWLAARRSDDLDRRLRIHDLIASLRDLEGSVRCLGEVQALVPAYGQQREHVELSGLARHQRDIMGRLPEEGARRVLEVAKRLVAGPKWIERTSLQEYGLPPTTIDQDWPRHGARADRKASGPGGQSLFCRKYLLEFVLRRWKPRACKATGGGS